jgi:uncharacterized protein
MSSRHSPHADPRSQFVLDTHQLGRRAGSMIELSRPLSAPADWRLDLVGVPAGSPVEMDVRLESVMEGVLVSVELQAPITADCGRCLEPVADTLDVTLAELFLYEPDPQDPELPVLDGDFADLEPVLRDAIVLALPLNPVCSEDCLGLCASCGARLADVEPGHRHDTVDPRWSALRALTEQNPGSSATMDEQPSASPIREN